VLGRLGDSRAIKPLQRLANDPFSDVRESAGLTIKKLSKK
jgi:HEAT repeat protein